MNPADDFFQYLKARERDNKILIAVDGSEMALQAVRYAASVLPVQRTEVVLLHIQSEFSELYSALGDNPLYRTEVPRIRSFMNEQQAGLDRFLETASGILKDAGFPEDAVRVKVRPRGNSVIRDIENESYADYSAVFLGRTGTSRVKDLLVKSASLKLAGRIQHIPVVVVGGNPAPGKIMMAFDGSDGALKAVAIVGAILGGSSCQVMMCYFSRETREDVKAKIHRLNIESRLKQAERVLHLAGLAPEQIYSRIISVDEDEAAHIVEAAMSCGYGTIAMGRRVLISFIDEFVIGRVSERVLKIADELVVWIT